MEGENPTRRYKWFRPRQAYRGTLKFQADLNFSTIFLYNSSTGPTLLVVRHVSPGKTNHEATWALGNYQGVQGTQAGTISPMYPTNPAGAGQLYQYDDPNIEPADFYFNEDVIFSFMPDAFPFAVLPPGWSLMTQAVDQVQSPFAVNFIWEEIAVDEIDYVY